MFRADPAAGWLSGTANLDAPTAAGISPFRDWEGYYALQLVQDWLNDRLYRELRSERGIAYTPRAQVSYEGTAILVTLVVFLFSDRLQKWLGKQAITAMERLMGLVLTAVSIEMLLSGFAAYMRNL